MFYIEESIGYKIMIYDTEDHTDEWISREEYEHALNLGIKILSKEAYVKQRLRYYKETLGVDMELNHRILTGLKNAKGLTIVPGDICNMVNLLPDQCENNDGVVLKLDNRVQSLYGFCLDSCFYDVSDLINEELVYELYLHYGLDKVRDNLLRRKRYAQYFSIISDNDEILYALRVSDA